MYTQGHGTGRHRGPSEAFSQPLVPPDSGWDPAEELAFMLQDALAEEASGVPPADAPVTVPAPGTPLENLQEITAELPPLRDSPKGHRKPRERGGPNILRAVSRVMAALAAVIACGVSFFGGLAVYEPLRLSVNRTDNGIVSLWPLLIYGPWVVASLSVLRAALHQRRAVHSWCVILFFSSAAMLLCVAQAPRTVVDIVTAALPGLAALACFQQLVRQITLTRPPRRTLPRHRSRPPSPPPPSDEPGTSTTQEIRRVNPNAAPPPPRRDRPSSPRIIPKQSATSR
ncbi:hypothetical protein SSP24_52660 [Streptomyces spinoverrucosus]|uniref:DUF2637 domain-containing protein n=2 Tax=Streptomyces spinoverrucosus TaxID=284043 RepID=A0A4Y3VPA7_9ACTN|nr:hypothetical protein [Streptomyces spinoverrucosus]GEC07611.1 hypothetical protein SSP24_52660 [Streptomyces spinoverrucosus]GHB61859.1 hypothetical protein GCM10010397_34900 [Streptomyces spinoverrucosus]